jgi:hypothetical protein
MMQNKMKELDLKEKSSKSLLANVLDMDDDFRPSSTLPHSHVHPHHPSHAQPQQNNGGFIRYSERNASARPQTVGSGGSATSTGCGPALSEKPARFPRTLRS